jgi:drug/metabolite transporter (DMT)-like permease
MPELDLMEAQLTPAQSNESAVTTAPIRASFALLAMVFIWGLNFSVAKGALAELTPLAFNALRFPLAAAVVYLALRSRGALPLPRSEDVWRILALGVLGNVIYQLFFIFGLDHSRAGTASVLLAGTPIVTALFSVALGQEEVPSRVWLGVIATFTGIGLVVYSGARTASGTTRDTVLGALLLLGATVSWAAYTVGSRSLVQRYGSLSVTAWMLWAGTIGIMLIGMPDLIALDVTRVQTETWLAVLYAGALSVGLAYLIWHYGVNQLGNTRTSVYSNLVPVMALAGAWLTRGEVPTLGQIAGATVIIGGVTIAQFR